MLVVTATTRHRVTRPGLVAMIAATTRGDLLVIDTPTGTAALVTGTGGITIAWASQPLPGLAPPPDLAWIDRIRTALTNLTTIGAPTP